MSTVAKNLVDFLQWPRIFFRKEDKFFDSHKVLVMLCVFLGAANYMVILFFQTSWQNSVYRVPGQQWFLETLLSTIVNYLFFAVVWSLFARGEKKIGFFSKENSKYLSNFILLIGFAFIAVSVFSMSIGVVVWLTS